MKIIEKPLHGLDMTLGLCEDISREEELETELKRYQSSNIELLEQLRSAIAIYNADENSNFITPPSHNFGASKMAGSTAARP